MAKATVDYPGFVSGSLRKRPEAGKGGAVRRKRVAIPFDPKAFLAKVGEGKAISNYKKDQIVFSQGEVGDAVFYIQKGKIKLTVVSERARRQSLASSGQVTFLAKGALTGIRCV